MRQASRRHLLLPVFSLVTVWALAFACAFVVSPPPRIIVNDARRSTPSPTWPGHATDTHPAPSTNLRASQTVYFDATELDDDKIAKLYAWVSRALAGDERYGNLMYALVAVFGSNLEPDNILAQLLKEAEDGMPGEEEVVGEPFRLYQREQASLGAMGAAQWTGQWKTRPHALLQVSEMSSVDDWVATLPRGCKRTLKKAIAGAHNFTVTTLPIQGGKPAPHSSLAHFRCVVEHEVRLLSDGSPEYFLDALSEAISRYVGTTRMAGTIQEYRDADTNKVIAIAHEVSKGRTVRGQWFYATDDASKRYVWFHSVHDLVRRAIETEEIDVVDLGPSGSDAFSDLKARYGFKSVDDWPAVADYRGDFIHAEGVDDGKKSFLEGIIEALGNDA